MLLAVSSGSHVRAHVLQDNIDDFPMSGCLGMVQVIMMMATTELYNKTNGGTLVFADDGQSRYGTAGQCKRLSILLTPKQSKTQRPACETAGAYPSTAPLLAGIMSDGEGAIMGSIGIMVGAIMGAMEGDMVFIMSSGPIIVAVIGPADGISPIGDIAGAMVIINMAPLSGLIIGAMAGVIIAASAGTNT